MKSQKELHQDKQKKYHFLFILLFILLIGTIIISFLIGYYSLSPSEVWLAFLSKFNDSIEVKPQAITIFWNIRFPRILAAILIGAALSTAGSVYQGIFQNPLVSPDILGVSAGASLGAALSIYLGFSMAKVQIFAFLGGILAVAVCYLISSKSIYNRTLSLVLTGSMVGILCNSFVTMIKYVSDPNNVLQQIVFWLMGSLTKVTMDNVLVCLGPMIIGFWIIFLLRWKINLLVMGEEEAQSMGNNTKKYRLLLIIASTLLSASAVCLGGLIGWVGLMVPHITRGFFGADYKRLIPGNILIGSIFLLIVDDVARSLLTMELPISVVTAILGAPFFVLLILRRKV